MDLLKLMLLFDAISKIDLILPKSASVEGDRVGLQLQSDVEIVKNVLIAFEITKETVDFAIKNSCELIISFHPLIWQPLTKIDNFDRVGSLVTKLIRNNIALYVVHTSYDTFQYGTSRIISDKLGMKFLDFIEINPNYPNTGMGVIAEYSNPIHFEVFLEKMANLFASPIKYSIGKNEYIKKIAIIGGSGTSYIDKILDLDVDAFITADATYHTFHRTNNRLWLFDPGHYEMEQFVVNGLTNLFKNENALSSLNFIATNITTNPIMYYPDGDLYQNKQMNILNNYGILNG